MLRRSAFTLCPGGTHEETYRVYEALEAGSVPVLRDSPAWNLLGGDHPLPVVPDWSRVREMVLLPLLRARDPAATADALQRRVVAWWHRFKQQHERSFAIAMRPMAFVNGVGTGTRARAQE